MSFGVKKDKSSQESGNQAFDLLRGAYGGQIGAGTGATNALSALLGVGGTAEAQAGQQQAFQNFLNSSGYNFQLQQGQNAITTSNAASGLLNSGATLKRLAGYGQGLASNYLQQYMSQLSNLSQQGLAAGGIVGSAGQYSKGKSSGVGFNFGFE